MKKLTQSFRGSLTHRLIAIFLVIGIGPTILLATLPGLTQYKANRLAVQDMNQELKLQAEKEMLQFASISALRYDQVFHNEAQTVQMLADYLGQGLQQVTPLDQEGIRSETDHLFLHGSGWLIRPSQQPIGFMQSPLATPSEGMLARRQAINQRSGMLASIVASNPKIRTSFIISEDQNIWIYPNRFWDQGQFLTPRSTDLTTRPYYARTQEIVWSNPYRDIETVVTVAAPIWADGRFIGMAGLDFSLSCVLHEILQTSVGEHGFMFFLGTQAQLIAMPEAASNSLLSPSVNGDPESLIDSSLLEVVPPEVRDQLETSRFQHQLDKGEPFLLTLDLPDGPAYLAVAPMPNVPWHVAVLRPEEEVSLAATNLGSRLEQSLDTLMNHSWLTGLGFLAVVLTGGWVTLRRLVFPIQRLSEGAAAIAKGELSHRVFTDDLDVEFRNLASTFNTMAESVQTTQEAIELKQTELAETLSKRESEFSALNLIAGLINRQGNLAGNLTEALEICLPILETDYLAISLIGGDGSLHHSAFAGTDPAGVDMIRSACDLLFDPAVLSGVLTGSGLTELQLTPLRRRSNDSACIKRLGLQQAVMTPVQSKGQIVAVLTLLQRQVSPLSPEARELLMTLSQHVAVLIENARLQQQIRDLVMIEERRRLASDLHDSVTQSLFSVSLAAEGLRASLPQDQPALNLLSQQVEQVQREMRGLIHELRPLDDDSQNLEPALRRHLEGLRRLNGVETELSITGDIGSIPKHTLPHLNRIAREAISNISRHAEASQVLMELEISKSAVRLKIEDDGCGFDPITVNQRTTSLGLLSMRERAELMSGALLLRSAPGEGTVLTLHIPLEEETERS